MQMISYVAILTLLSVGSSNGAANWLGTFSVDNSCDQTECCCVSDQATITKASDTQLLVSANVAGAPCHSQLNGSTSISVPLPIPTDKDGYQIETNFLGTLNRFTLSDDSAFIANVNIQFPKCSGLAARVSSNWIGTYDIDDSCNQKECCCLSKQATITRVSDTQLLVAGAVAGEPCKAQLNGSTYIEVPIPIPRDKQGFQLTTTFLGTTNRFTLTYDNAYIANTNLQFPRCSGTGRRADTPKNLATCMSSASIMLSMNALLLSKILFV